MDWKVVMDCSNGANSVIVPVIFYALAEVVTIFNQPNGININNNAAGSTHLEALQAK